VSNAVLIADGQAARSSRVAKACAARGFETALARHGAEALEAALQDVPDVIVAPVDLGLIDAQRLSEILRANPRTQDVRFLFLGRPPSARAMGPFDEALPTLADADEVALRVEAMLAQRARVQAVEQETQADHEVQGKLSQIPLTDLLQLFHMNRRTGLLELFREEPGGAQERGAIWVRDGHLTQAQAGRVEGEKALFRMLAWRDGSFAFAPNRASSAPRMLTPTRSLLLEGMRQLDEWDRMRGSLPPLDARVTLVVKKADLPSSVHPLTQEVLLLLEIHDVVRDVVDHCSYPDYQVLRTLQALVDRRLVKLSREAEGVREAGPALFTPLQVRRLRDWLQAGRPRSAGPTRDARLLLISPDPAGTRDFVRLLGGLPGMTLAAPFERGTFAPDDVAPVGRLGVGEGLGIELLHVPGAARFAPIWPLASHRALGAMVLLPCEAEPTVDLEPLRDTLRRQPHARIFHVLLLRKGERVAPEELQRRFSLLDESSLFLVQLESGKEPSALLRTMLARVLP
jgi:ActR/RegA family two-component response regulator